MEARKVTEIENTLGKLDILIVRSGNILDHTPEELKSTVPKSAHARLRSNREKLAAILEVSGRRHLKTVFFGRTSSGKSSTINALLEDRVLPMGLGHTTSCFVEVKGTSKMESELVIPSEEEEVPSKAVPLLRGDGLGAVAHALSSSSLGPDSCVRLLWPRHRCPLLRDDVVLVDTPGVDIDADFDVWIERFCLDADLFVWVVNGESTLMQREKAFFEQVAAKLAKPNILVVVNRWDCASEEEEYLIHAAHSQHVERTAEFLVSQMKVATSKSEVERQRIFFVSSKEVIEAKSSAALSTAPDASNQSRLAQERRREWDRFREAISANASQSLNGARYLPFLEAGVKICSEVSRLNHALVDSCIEAHREGESARRRMEVTLVTLESGMAHLTHALKIEIQVLLDSVGPTVECAVAEEADGLPELVEDFDNVFYDDPIIRDVYRDQLVTFVETGLNRNLVSKLSPSICGRVESKQLDIISRVGKLLPEEKRDFIDITTRRMPLDMNCAFQAVLRPSLEEFREDIKFAFSLRPAVLQRSYRNFRRFFTSSWSRQDASFWQRWSSASMATSEASFVASLVAVCAAYRSVSWKVLISAGLVYSTAYAAERLMWTNRAKERATKRQFASYAASSGLSREWRSHLTDLCREQAHKELHSTLVLSCAAAEGAGREIRSEKNRLNAEDEELTEAMRRANDVIEDTNEVEQKLKAMKRSLK